MTDREIMQQALDALDRADRISGYPNNSEIRNALRERLEQPEQKRKWVGLTKEEAREISLANRPYVIDMLAAWEAKLREKNGAQA